MCFMHLVCFMYCSVNYVFYCILVDLMYFTVFDVLLCILCILVENTNDNKYPPPCVLGGAFPSSINQNNEFMEC